MARHLKHQPILNSRMTSREAVNPDLQAALRSIYEEIMWLAIRPNVTPSRARAWYTHVMAESVKLRVRHFSGFVSETASKPDSGMLRLEHYGRIQTSLTGLVERHLSQKLHDPDEFVRTLIDLERVHIVTMQENYDVMRTKGDYDAAGVLLLSWFEIDKARRATLWASMLRGKVANAAAFVPG